jgi:drug/metabolite transporter (DMT)-like permease
MSPGKNGSPGNDAVGDVKRDSCAQPSMSSTSTMMNLTYTTVWIGLSASVIMFNKYILAYAGFPFPITLTVWHMIFSGTISTIMVHSGIVMPSDEMCAYTYARAILPIGALFAGTLWLGNAAYLHLSVSFIQMLKAFMPASVYFVGCMFRTEVPSWKTWLNMCLITFGVIVASLGELIFVPIGVAMQVGSILTESTRLALVQILLHSQGLKLNPVTTLYYIAPASCAFLLIPWSFAEAEKLWIAHTSGELLISPVLLVANAACAFGLNLSVFLLIGKTSALTMNVAGVIKDWLLIWLSAWVYHSSVTRLGLAGYGVAFVGVCIYNRSKLQK